MVGVSIDALIHYQKRHKVWRKNSMDKKSITYMKIIIPVMAAIVIIGGAIVYFTKQSKAQEVMAPIVTEQSVVTESEVSEPAPQPAKPDPAPSAEPEATETVEDLENGINSTHTDVILGDDEYKGDNADIDDDYRSMYTEEENEAIDKAIDEAIDDILEEYYQSNPNQAPTTGYQGPPVGTPSTGELPTYNFGESGQDGIDKNATVY